MKKLVSIRPFNFRVGSTRRAAYEQILCLGNRTESDIIEHLRQWEEAYNKKCGRTRRSPNPQGWLYLFEAKFV